jgi:adenylylsulfate reductase subunit A
MTTVPGLFAAGETAGGNPNKFVGGCAAEGKLALRGAAAYIAGLELPEPDAAQVDAEKARVFAPLLRGEDFDGLRALEMEERLQRLMDEYAGGTSQFYRTNEERLDYALKHLAMLRSQVQYLKAGDLHDLMAVHEVIDRIDVAEVLCHHLRFRKETRWQGWQTRSDYPEVDPAYDCHVESRKNLATGEIETFTRPYEQLVAGDRYKP